MLEHDDYCEEYDDVDDNKLKTRPKEKIAVRLEAHPAVETINSDQLICVNMMCQIDRSCQKQLVSDGTNC